VAIHSFLLFHARKTRFLGVEGPQTISGGFVRPARSILPTGRKIENQGESPTVFRTKQKPGRCPVSESLCHNADYHILCPEEGFAALIRMQQ